MKHIPKWCGCMQSGVDKHTVARVWQFLRDAHYVDAHTTQLQLSAMVINHEAQTLAVWHLRISMLSAGRFRGRASVTTAPSHDGPGRRRTFSTTARVAAYALALLHTLFVVGLLPSTSGEQPLSSPGSRGPAKDGDAPSSTQHSVWFRLCCIAAFLGLTASLVLSLCLGSAARRLVQEFETSDESMPADEYLPVTMYHNLWAPARMLLPRRAASTHSSAAEGVCELVSDGSRADLRVDSSSHSSMPLWERPADPRSYENLSLMMVRPHVSYIL